MQNLALKQLIVQRDAKLQQLETQLQIDDGKRSVKNINRINGKQAANITANHPEFFDDILAQLTASRLQNDELKSENRSLKSINFEQARALKQITNANDFPHKVKILQEDLRSAKDKILKYQLQQKDQLKNSQL